jgi:hypothetical protein
MPAESFETREGVAASVPSNAASKIIPQARLLSNKGAHSSREKRIFVMAITARMQRSHYPPSP